MEELLIQRQKRIAERSAAKGVNPETSKRSSKESKRNTVPAKTEKAKLQSSTDENKKSHKPIMRSSTIDRLAAARTTTRQSSTETKVGQNKKPTSKGNSLNATSSLKKTKETQEKQDKAKNLSDNNSGTDNTKSNSPITQRMHSTGTTHSVSEDSRDAERILDKNVTEDFVDVKVLHTVTSVDVKDASDDKNSIEAQSDKDPSTQVKLNDNIDDRVELTPEIKVLPTAESNLQSAALNTKERGEERRKLTFSPEVSVVHISTPPPDNETDQDLSHSRKKWNDGESTLKVPKGFRKLLLFGRRT